MSSLAISDILIAEVLSSDAPATSPWSSPSIWLAVSSSDSAPTIKIAILPPTATVPPAAPANKKFLVLLFDVALTFMSPAALTRVL